MKFAAPSMARYLAAYQQPVIRVLFCLLIAWPAATGWAENPDWPNGPEEDPRLAPPDDGNFADRWYLLSYIPSESLDTIREEEIPLGSGVHADRAYQVTIGSPQVVIAVLDSGIYFDDHDLVNKFFLNQGELPLPLGSEVYDANGDGVFDIRDYDGDERVHDANGNGRIEPGDLIRIFSDGADQDGNGYVDDISGWDFYHHDNDPTDDTRYGHGTGEARWAAAETNNGVGGSGVCPRCRILPVRVADSFVADANNFAQGVIFAVDSGAKVILEALGTINNTPFARDAVAYAVDQGVSIAASAADENSFHHNFPATYNRTIHTNNIIPDTDDRSQITSFMALDACTNWGPKITVSASSFGCSSGATGIMGGALGMIYSRAEEIGLYPPLSSDEVFGIVTMSATDIYVPEAQEDPTIYPSRQGWDKYFGHGRLNLRAAVDMVAPGTIPPEAHIDSPGWFGVFDHSSGSIPVIGRVAASRADFFEYTLEIASGHEPEEDDWRIVSRVEDLASPVEGVLGIIDTNALPSRRAINRDVTDHNAYLLRLVVIDSLGNLLLRYHSFFILQDADWAPGFPKDIGASGEASPLMADLDGDGIFELIVADSSGLVHAFLPGGGELEGWPVETAFLVGQDPQGDNYLGSAAYRDGHLEGSRHQAIMGSPAVGDLDMDGIPEVVVATLDGAVHAWSAGGEPRPGFPLWLDPSHLEDDGQGARLEYGIAGSPVLANLDGDPAGTLEILVAGMDQWVYAWRHDGSPLAGWPVLCREQYGRAARIVSSPAVGDIDGDGRLEVMITTNEVYDGRGRMYAVDARGNQRPGSPFLPGWPVALWSIVDSYLPLIGEGTPTSPALADFDGDGDDEIVVSSGIGTPLIYDGDGRFLRNLSPLFLGPFDGSVDILMGTANGNFSIGVLRRRDNLSVMAGGIGARQALQMLYPGKRIVGDALVGAWDAGTGKMHRFWPRVIEGAAFFSAQAVADLDGDGLPEVISGSPGHYLHASDFYGRQPAGWPKFTGGWIAATPAVGDMDGDGYLEVAVTTREGLLFVWNTKGPADGNIEWPSHRHDPGNTGNYGSPFPRQEGPPEPTDDDDDTADDDSEDTDDDDAHQDAEEEDGETGDSFDDGPSREASAKKDDNAGCSCGL